MKTTHLFNVHLHRYHCATRQSNRQFEKTAENSPKNRYKPIRRRNSHGKLNHSFTFNTLRSPTQSCAGGGVIVAVPFRRSRPRKPERKRERARRDRVLIERCTDGGARPPPLALRPHLPNRDWPLSSCNRQLVSLHSITNSISTGKCPR